MSKKRVSIRLSEKDIKLLKAINDKSINRAIEDVIEYKRQELLADAVKQVGDYKKAAELIEKGFVVFDNKGTENPWGYGEIRKHKDTSIDE